MKLFGFDIKRANAETKAYATNRLYNRGLSSYTISQNTFYDLYKSNCDIRLAVRKIAMNVSRNGIYLEDNNRQIIDNEELASDIAKLFQAPTFNKFKTELFKNYLLSGELYIIPTVNMKGETAGFKIIDSRAVSKTTDGKGNIVAYEVNQIGANYVLKPDQVAFFKLEEDINNTINGMGLLNGVLYDALSDYEASKTNYSLYMNSAVPSAILLLDGDLSADEQQIAKEVFDAQFRGSENAHKTLVGGGIKDIKTLSLSPRDMEFINQRHLTTEKVCATFGVPKSILGYVDSVNYANGRELRKEFIEGTIRPYELELEHILNTLMQRFMPSIWNKYRIKCDGEQLEEQQERFESQRKDIETGIITINEARIDRGLEPTNEEYADKHLIGKNVVLLEDITLDAVLSPNEI